MAQSVAVSNVDVGLGIWDQRRVVRHAITTAGLADGEDLQFSASFQQLGVNCVDMKSSAPRGRGGGALLGFELTSENVHFHGMVQTACE